MMNYKFRRVVSSCCFFLAAGLATLLTATTTAVGQTVLINPALEGGFELGSTFAANGWTVVNGSGVTNQWNVGTVPTGFTNNSAYISNDAGVNNTYTNSAASVVHFYRDVTFPAGETAIGLNFNWKANGESGFYDALIVSIAPTSYNPVSNSTSLVLNTIPAPAVELGRFWLQTTTQNATIQIPPSLVGNCSSSSTMRLIFTWKNDGSGGTNAPAAVDNIQLVSNINTITSSGGTFTIDNTLPLSATNFPSFTAAITALNGASGCLLNPVVFNVAAGQTFNELPPVITAFGLVSAPITFQKSGAGSNPVIVSVGAAGTNDGSIVISGGDYITFDGIDIDNSASNSMEYGYIIRNFSATDGAKNNIIRNSTVRMHRGVTTSSSCAFLISTTTSGGGVNATNASGTNDNNQLRNITINGAFNGVSFLGTSGFPDLNNQIGTTGVLRNSISNIGPNVSTFVSSRGIHFSNQSGSSITETDISSVTSNQGTAQGIFLTGCLGNTLVNRNSIYAVSNQGSTTTTSVAYGIQAQNATTGTNVIRISNNMVGNVFTSFTGTATTTRYAIGIHVGVASATNSQSYEVYHNTVSIGNGLTPTYSNSCFEIQNVAAVYKVQNNLFANFTGAQGATAKHYTWVTTSATNIGATGSVSNNNDLYIASDVNVSGFVARANTTNIATVLAWTTAITAIPGTDQNSFSGAPVFVNNNSDLHLNMGVTPTQIESSGSTSLGVSSDIDGQNRPGPTGSVNGGATAPDCGADEFDGSPLSPPVITLNSVTPPATVQCSAISRLVSVNIANVSGTLSSVSLAYSFNGVAQGAFPMTNVSGTTWEATIPAATPVNASVTWAVAATNSFALTGTFTGTSYADEPQLGVTATATASSATVCSNNPSMLTATLNKPGQIATGTGSTSSTNVSATNPFYGGFGGVKSQYIIRASELTAAGLSAGNITQLGMTVTTVGSTLSGFAISVENTALTALTGNIENVGNQVFSTASFVPALGVNNFPFSTPLMWDGTSNLIVSICWSNNNTSNTASQVLISNPGFTSSNARYVDSKTSAEVCGYIGNTLPSGWNGASTTTTSRPIFIVSGNVAPAISSVTWMDGATTVGTGNPLTVNPTATTSYTANITSSGCIATPAPTTTVTVNPLPATPTAVNSAQCGTQVPSASVTSTSGLPTPTFNWYAAASGGTALQSSTSTTYTTALSTTTTFYVSELNTVTGCESARVAVTVNVSSPDNILAATSSATVCVGSPVTLTVSNTNPTPFQNYTYTWTNAQAGSGLTSATGASQTITPTQSGSFTYDVAGVDGGCTAVSSIAVTVTPYTATLTPINITCNGANNGSFSVASESCGTANLYAVDGGAFGPLPTNLTPGAHTVIVQNTGGYQTAPISITISEPVAVPAPLGISNATICQGNPSATLTVPATGSQSTTVNFSLSAQPLEGNSAPGNVIATATLPTLPAGVTVNSVVLSSNGIIPNGGEYQSDVRLGLSGAFTNAAAQGTGTIGSGTVAGTPYNYTRSIPGTGFPTNGGTINVVYWNSVNDVSAGDDATFPLGASAITLTINYSFTNPSVNWYSASSAGTLQGTGTPFQTVGTTVLPNTNTPGTYTFYAEGTNGACVSATRTPVTVTVNSTSTSTTTVSACGSYTWTNGTTYTTSGTYTRTLTNYLGCDSVATLALTIKLPTTATQTASACSSYTWPVNGTTYSTSGSYTHTLVGANAAGCDSTITLNLTIKLPTTSTQSASACVSYTWPVNGTTYTTSGAYTHTLNGANAVGCDSTITLNLMINQPTTATQTATACSSYTWAVNGTTYSASGAYTHTLIGANAAGCDSTITLNLTINQPTTGVDVQTACDSYTWINGVTYTASNNTATFTLTNAAGCDSVVTLNLTINQPTSGTDVQTACDTYTWIDGITYTVSNNTATFTLTNAAGCDSVVTLNLTINNSTTGSESATACGSYTWATDGNTYTTSGAYTATLVNAAGCDLIVTLNLTINNSTTGTDVQTACDSYTWIDGVTYTASNNTATFTLANAAGCDSIVTLNLTITGTPVATATDNGNGTITASSGATYQWIDCATGTAIAGANSQTFTVTANGNYAVVVANGSCDDTSACVLIDYIGIKEITDASIEVSPNPTSGVVMIKMTAPNAKVSVMDAQGKLLNVITVENAGTVDLSTYQTGVYILNIETENGRSLERIIKN